MNNGVKQSEVDVYDGDGGGRQEYGSIWSGKHQHSLLAGPKEAFWRSVFEAAATGRTLVLGCGAGRTVERLEQAVDGEVIGIELSKTRLHEATERADRGELFRADAEQLPFSSGSFDTIVAKSILHHLPDWAGSGLDEIRRVLTSSGSLVFYEPGRFNPPAAIRRRFYPSNIHTPHEAPFDPKRLRHELEQSFVDVSIEGHCLLSNTLPVVFNCLPLTVPEKVTGLAYRYERPIVSTIFSRYAWILTGVARGVSKTQ